MSIFQTQAEKLPYYEDLCDILKKPGDVPVVFGCADQQKAHLIGALSKNFSQKLIITHTELKARALFEDFCALGENAVFYPAKDFIFYSADIHGNQIIHERLNALSHIINDDKITVITTIGACIDKLNSKQFFINHSLQLDVGEDIELSEISERLVMMGFEKVPQIEGMGQFAVRGGILDIFPIGSENPVRIELWDTQIDSMRYFDVQSQRSVENIFELLITPASEILYDSIPDGFEKLSQEADAFQKKLKKSDDPAAALKLEKVVSELKERIFELFDYSGLDKYSVFFIEHPWSLVDYFSHENALIVIDEPNRADEVYNVIYREFTESMEHRLLKGEVLPLQLSALCSLNEFYAKLGSRHCMSVSSLDCKLSMLNVCGHFDIGAKNAASYNNSFETLVSDLKNYAKRGYNMVLVSSSKTRAQRLAADLYDNGVAAVFSEDPERAPIPGEVMTVCGKLRHGYEYPDTCFICISEDDVFGNFKKKKRKKFSYDGKNIASLSELSIGDYVIHENHGLGIYRGIEKIEVDKIEKDYIRIDYAGKSILYIPATNMDLLQKYAGKDAKTVKLNSLTSSEWHNTKARVKKAVYGVAENLVKLYATRQESEGYQYGADTPWQNEFEELFPFEETEDQTKAINDTKKDMESTKIMDRLICGDVGFGKTEVALRAAFKAVMGGKQVAYLVPTTILAKQHFTTFDTRMKNFGVKVAMLSRFCTPKEIKDTLANLKKGLVDVVIGTHRLLSKDVQFKDLGLLIIDEEQRFGVTHKERIKELKQTVDVLTLTATPIPRTLHMSLIGVRDMSVLTEPPVDRLPIQTFVTEYDEEMVREAVNRELARGGQVYYVFNKVIGIEEATANLRLLIPDANIAYAHGKMSERELENIMMDFINGEIDVLVSTTIIETGLDIPNVNTIIIHDSDRFGLSQLYQLRGRVGRSGRTAYAFLMYKRDKLLKEEAEKRLSAIKEFTELGSGIKIAMKDLEIRGAGNLLGEEQHGHMEAVGYDLYCKMLSEALSDLKGLPGSGDFETKIDVEADAFIPVTYIRSESQKLDMYKRIATISTKEELEDITDELTDRFGDVPKSALDLCRIAFIKNLAHSIGITEIKADKKQLLLRLNGQSGIDPEKLPAFLKGMINRVRFCDGAAPYFIYFFDKNEIRNNDTYLDCIESFIDKMTLLKKKENTF